MQALIVTPNPNPTESLMGYILRVSEANGYTTPTVILKYAGMEDRNLSRNISIEKLAVILNKPPSVLAPLSNRCNLENGSDGFKILTHQFAGNPLTPYMRLDTPVICPDCVAETGYVDAFWDCALAVACPFHKRVPIEVCNECGNSLTWFRSGLLMCRCGQSLCQPNVLPPPSETVLEFMNFLWARFHDQSTSLFENPCGLPLAALEKLPLKTFIKLLDAFARLVTTERTIEKLTKLEVIEKAGQLLTDWPHNFREFLHDVKTCQIKLLGSDISFSTCFRQVYANLLHTYDPKEVSFIRQEYDNYVLNYWDGSKMNSRTKSKGLARFVSMNELAARVGVRPITILGLTTKGMLKVKSITTGKQARWVFDTTQIQMPVSIDSNTMGVRAAAALVGIPVTVLLQLRKSGHYKVKNLFLHKDAFSELDLLAFKNQLLATCDHQLHESTQKQTLISMQHLLQRNSFKSKSGKADFVAAYLDKKIIPAGNTGDSFSQIFFHKKDVFAFQSGCRYEFCVENGFVTLRKAVELLGTFKNGVHALVDAGILTRSGHVGFYSLDRRPIELFAEQYIGFTALATSLKTTSWRLKNLCKKSSIDFLEFEDKRNIKSQFIKISDREKLITVSDLNPRKIRNPQPGSHPQIDTYAICESYLQELRSNNQGLPMKANTYDKTRVGRACGFSRNVIYGNKRVKKLLDDYLVEYNERNSLIALPSDRLKRYIDQLKSTKSKPPSSNGKLIKHSVAKICDFDRHVLYRDPLVIELMKNLEMAVAG